MIQLWGSLSHGALPASVVKTTVHAIHASTIPTGQAKLSGHAGAQLATVFSFGFLRTTPTDQKEENLPVGSSCKPPFPLGTYGGSTLPGGSCGGRRSFGHGGRGNFHKVFEYDISALQSESAVLAQVLRDTPQDVPLDFSYQTAELRVNVPKKSAIGVDVGVVRKCGQCMVPTSIYYRLLYLQGYAGVVDTHGTLVSFRTTNAIKIRK